MEVLAFVAAVFILHYGLLFVCSWYYAKKTGYRAKDIRRMPTFWDMTHCHEWAGTCHKAWAVSLLLTALILLPFLFWAALLQNPTA